jgi:FkbM family methyltransferase
VGWFSKTVRENPGDPPGAGGEVTREHVIWAYRLLLDREPESEDAILPKVHGCATTRRLRAELMNSTEFREKNPDYAHTNDPTVVIKPYPGGLRICVDLSDHLIGLPILRDQYEPDARRFVERTVRQGQHVLDVGAHIGFFTLHMASRVGPSGSVTAFEPFPDNADLLARSITENRFDAFVHLHRAAVGARGAMGRLAFARETLNTGGAFLVPDAGAAPGELSTTEVPIVALDDLDLPRPVAFVKLDVEGAEPLVVEGARRLLASDRPIVLSEIHVAQLDAVAGQRPADYIGALAALGYDCRTLTADGPGETVDPAALGPVTTVVFVPK